MRHSILFASLVFVAAGATAYAQTSDNGNGNGSGNDISVTVNGNPVQFRGQGPIMSQDRVFVPLRGVFQRMGAHVDWDPSTQTVTADKGPTHVRLTIGLRTASINGEPTSLDLPAQIMDGATMVPLRFVSEALGANVDWNAQNQTVMIDTGTGYVPHPSITRNEIGSRPMQLRTRTYLPSGTIIQATLTQTVSSEVNRRGDRVTADVTDNSLGLPRGTRLQGYVDGVRRRANGRPGWLSLEFTTLILPNGDTYPVTGTFTGVGHVGANWIHNAYFQSGTAFGVRLTHSLRFRH